MNAFRATLDDLAAEVRPVDLSGRVTAGIRRRKQRRVAAVAFAALAVVAGTTALVAQRPQPLQPTGRPASYDVVWTSLDPLAHLHGQAADGERHDLGEIGNGAMDLSPDGTRVACVCPEGLVVRVLRDGRTAWLSVPEPVPPASYPVWSPDGTRVLVRRAYRDASVRGYAGFQVVDATDGGFEDVIAYPHDADRHVSWSPDGKAVLLPRDGGFDLVSVTDGKRLRRVAVDGTLASSHAWSPDGRYLLLSRRDTESSDRTLVVSVATGRTEHEVAVEGAVWRTTRIVVGFEDDPFGPKVAEYSLDRAIVVGQPFAHTGNYTAPVLRPAS